MSSGPSPASLLSMEYYIKLFILTPHHQNRVVERKYRHVVEIGLTLLSQASIPLTYWDYSLPIIVYLINRLPYGQAILQLPQSFWMCFLPPLRPYQSHKLKCRSQECLFFSYSTSHKGYRYISSSGRLYIYKDVFFNELRFPYSKLFAKSHILPLPVQSVTLSALQFGYYPFFPSTSNNPFNISYMHVPSSIESNLTHSTHMSTSVTPQEPTSQVPPSTVFTQTSPSSHHSSYQSSESATLSQPDMSQTSSSCFYVFIPPHIVLVSHILVNTHSMTTRAKVGFTQLILEPKQTITHIH